MIQVPVTAVASDAHELGPQDVVIVAVKGPALASIATGLGPLLTPNTIVLPAMNGVPWWFGNSIASLAGRPLESVDLGGKIASAIPHQHVIGCVVHVSTSTTEPGLVQHKMGQGLVIGEPNGGQTERVRMLGNLVENAGFDVTQSENICFDIWYKLWTAPSTPALLWIVESVFSFPLMRSKQCIVRISMSGPKTRASRDSDQPVPYWYF